MENKTTTAGAHLSGSSYKLNDACMESISATVGVERDWMVVMRVWLTQYT